MCPPPMLSHRGSGDSDGLLLPPERLGSHGAPSGAHGSGGVHESPSVSSLVDLVRSSSATSLVELMHSYSATNLVGLVNLSDGPPET